MIPGRNQIKELIPHPAVRKTRRGGPLLDGVHAALHPAGDILSSVRLQNQRFHAQA